MDKHLPQLFNLDDLLEDKKYHTTEEFISELDIASKNKDLFYYVDDDDKWKVLIPPGLFTLAAEPTPAQMLLDVHRFGPILVPFIGPYQLQILYQTPNGLECWSQDPALMIPIYIESGKALETLKLKREGNDEQQEFHLAVQSVLQMLMTVQAVSDAENSRLAHKIATHLSRNPKNKLPSSGPLWNKFLSRLGTEIKNISRDILKGFIPDTPSDSPAISTSAIDNLILEQSGTFIEKNNKIETNNKFVAWFNERAACYIESHFALQGKRFADYIRNLENSFAIWTTRKKESPYEPWLINLGKVIWFDEFEEMRARIERKPGPAMLEPVAKTAAKISQRNNTVGPSSPPSPGHILYDTNRQPILELRRCSGPVLPANHAQNIVSILTNGAAVLGSVYTLRFLWWLCTRVWEQWIQGGNSAVTLVRIEGGWGGLCRCLDIIDKSSIRKELKEIVQLLAHGYFEFPDGTGGNLLSYNEELNQNDKRLKTLIISVGSPLLPDTVAALQGNTEPSRRARHLIPLAPIPDEPPRSKLSADKHGAVANFYLRTLTLFRERCSQIVKYKGVKIEGSDWQTLADAAGLSNRDMNIVLEHWTQKRGWLERQENGRYHIADMEHYTFARQMIEDAGRMEANGSKGGLSRVARKAKKLNL